MRPRRCGSIRQRCNVTQLLSDIYQSPEYVARLRAESSCHFSSWLSAVLVVEFDTSEGHRVSREYPPGTLTAAEKSRLTHISLPDSRSATTLKFRGGSSRVLVGESPNWLGFRFRRDSCLPLNRSSIAEQTFSLGAAFFRSVEDDTCRRGARQESVVILSPLPTHFFFPLILPVALYLGELYFSYGSSVIFDVCSSVAASWPALPQWEKPDQVLRLITRHADRSLFLLCAAHRTDVGCAAWGTTASRSGRGRMSSFQKRSAARRWYRSRDLTASRCRLIPWLCSHRFVAGFNASAWTPCNVVALWPLLQRHGMFSILPPLQRKKTFKRLWPKFVRRRFNSAPNPSTRLRGDSHVKISTRRGVQCFTQPHELENSYRKEADTCRPWVSSGVPWHRRAPTGHATFAIPNIGFDQRDMLRSKFSKYSPSPCRDQCSSPSSCSPHRKAPTSTSPPRSRSQDAFFRRPCHAEWSRLPENGHLSGACFSERIRHRRLSESFVSSNLIVALGPLLECIWSLWELALTEAPLLIIAGNSMRASAAVFNVLRLLYPLQYAADHRPYINAYDADLPHYRQAFFSPRCHALAPISVVMGGTDPFLLQTLSLCPNIMVIGAPKSLCSPSSCVSSSSSLSKHRHRPGFPLQSSTFSLVTSASGSSTLLFAAVDGSPAPAVPNSSAAFNSVPSPSQSNADTANVFWLRVASKDPSCGIVPKDPELLSQIQTALGTASSTTPGDAYIVVRDPGAHNCAGLTAASAEAYVTLERDIFAYFEHLTRQFLHAFHQFLQPDLKFLMLNPILDTPTPLPFTPTNFLDALEETTVNLAPPFDSIPRTRVLDLYRRFISTQTFRSWFSTELSTQRKRTQLTQLRYCAAINPSVLFPKLTLNAAADGCATLRHLLRECHDIAPEADLTAGKELLAQLKNLIAFSFTKTLDCSPVPSVWSWTGNLPVYTRHNGVSEASKMKSYRGVARKTPVPTNRRQDGAVSNSSLMRERISGVAMGHFSSGNELGGTDGFRPSEGGDYVNGNSELLSSYDSVNSEDFWSAEEYN